MSESLPPSGEDLQVERSGAEIVQRPRRRVYGNLARLCIKELRETLRDRRTIMTLVLMPLLVYPLLSMAFQKFFLTSFNPTSELVCLVGADSEASIRRVSEVVEFGDHLLKLRLGERDGVTGEELPPPDEELPPRDEAWLASGAPPKPRIQWVSVAQPEAFVADMSIDVAVLVEMGERDPMLPELLNPPLKCTLVYRENSPAGEAAVAYLESRLRIVDGAYLEEQLAVRRVPWTMPVTLAHRKIESGAGGDGFSLATLIPLILILMTITGAVYPAIDLTAGERERGTLESLIAAPVSRLRLLSAKYVAVLTVALLTASVNLLSMMVTIAATGLTPVLFGERGFTIGLVASICGLMMLFAAFFSALLLAITSVARSFKEAQAYLIPLMVVAIAPGFLSLMPNIQFTGWLAVVPLVNIALLARDMLQEGIDPSLALVTIVATAFYAFAAIGLSARVFGSDAILYGSKGKWSDLWKRSEPPRPAAAVDTAMLCLAALFPIYFVATGFLAQGAELPMSVKLGLSALVTAVLFGTLPVLAAKWTSVQLRPGLQLHSAPALHFIAAVVLGVSLWPFAYELFLLNRAFGWLELGGERLDSTQKLMEAWQELSPLWIILTLGIVPAVFEELFFRGFLLGALKRATAGWLAVVVSALLFGGFHVVATDLLAERLLPSTFLGLVLGFVCYRSGSVLPGMVLHACHNSLMLLATRYPKLLGYLGLDLETEGHLPAMWIVGGLLGALAGALCLLPRPRGTPDVPVAPSKASSEEA